MTPASGCLTTTAAAAQTPAANTFPSNTSLLFSATRPSTANPIPESAAVRPMLCFPVPGGHAPGAPGLAVCCQVASAGRAPVPKLQ